MGCFIRDCRFRAAKGYLKGTETAAQEEIKESAVSVPLKGV
jgi:hypothetical protein